MLKANYQLTSVDIVTPLSSEPVTLPEVVAWMKTQAITTEDDIQEELITSARLMLENLTGLSFGPTGLSVLYHVGAPGDLVDLPRGPVTAVSAVSQLLAFTTEETLGAGVGYELVGDRLLRFNACGDYKVEYTGGFTELPIDLKTDIYRLVAWQYQNRGILFEAEDRLRSYPAWMALASQRYVKTVI